ncbi:MAG TPA: hypothetical protein VG206_00855 [Terriglobia bacterium]|nr:hypothetical protein [Terriglobia bacterium]
MRKRLVCLLSYSILFLNVRQVLAQSLDNDELPAAINCFSTKTVLNEYANGQVGLTQALVQFRGGEYLTELMLAWGQQGTNELASMTSSNGVDWENLVVQPGTYVQDWSGPPFAPGGVGMTRSSYCNATYVAWMDNHNNLWGALTTNGAIGFTSPYFIYGGAMSPPALRGDLSSLPIGFAYSIYNSTFELYDTRIGTFGCEFQNPVLLSGTIFGNFEGDYLQNGPWTPAYAGANGTTEIRGVAEGKDKAIIYMLNAGPGQYSAGTNWADNGLAGAVNPATGRNYLAWTCSSPVTPTAGCKIETNNINILNVNTGDLKVCTDWSTQMPSLWFYNNMLWVAWKGGDNNGGNVNVASMTPF